MAASSCCVSAQLRPTSAPGSAGCRRGCVLACVGTRQTRRHLAVHHRRSSPRDWALHTSRCRGESVMHRRKEMCVQSCARRTEMVTDGHLGAATLLLLLLLLLRLLDI